jgi:hypothetical protein
MKFRFRRHQLKLVVRGRQVGVVATAVDWRLEVVIAEDPTGLPHGGTELQLIANWQLELGKRYRSLLIDT